MTASTPQRADHDLGHLLRYENVAWYDGDVVKITDRRVYPYEIRQVVCETVDDVAQAIADMVTQSAGPYTAAGMGMALAAKGLTGSDDAKMAKLRDAADRLSTARPTTESRMRRVTGGALRAAEQALAEGRDDLDRVLFDVAFNALERRYGRMAVVASHLVDLFPPKHATILTQCFAETIVGTALREAKDRGIDVKLYCPETRPYFQGARLTASVAADMGVDVTVITDNMPAELLSHGEIDLFTTAADAITTDGYVVNKVGTLQIAIAAHHFGVPYFVTGIPDTVAVADIEIEQRDARQVLETFGRRHTADGVKGYYPAFDITPPHFVAGVVTDQGILTPYALDQYDAGDPETDDFYGGLII